MNRDLKINIKEKYRLYEYLTQQCLYNIRNHPNDETDWVARYITHKTTRDAWEKRYRKAQEIAHNAFNIKAERIFTHDGTMGYTKANK